MTFFDPEGVLREGLPQRLPFGLADADGALLTAPPDELPFAVEDERGRTLGGPTTVAARSDGLPRAYFPLEIAALTAGRYTAVTEVGGEELRAAFAVAPSDVVSLLQVGDPMPRIASPTAEASLGVDPICSREPACPLHTVSLDAALGSGRAVAVLVSTPAFCQVAICGPVLELLLEADERFAGELTCIHVEVYRSGDHASHDLSNADLAPTVDQLRLPFEPCLIVVGADGRIRARLDAIFDRSELVETLTAAVAS